MLTDAILLDEKTAKGKLFEKLAQGKVRCFACGHRCVIFPDKRGICKVRYNQGGNLLVPQGYVSSLQCDPIEKKPFYHVLPGSGALTFGMLGCDFHCSYCQNWNISQSLRDPESSTHFTTVTAEKICSLAIESQAKSIVSSYNEPLITAEWAAEIFEIAKKKDLKTGFVSNGNATEEVLKFLRPYTDCYKVDLKSMRQENYRELGGTVSVVLKTIEDLIKMSFWVEIVTLVVPGFNDSDQELKDIAKFIHSVSPDIPWHVTAFHSDYRMMDFDHTSGSALLRAAEIGTDAGLKFVYAGNIPGRAKNYEDTQCPTCKTGLIKRRGFFVRENNLLPGGKCPSCQTGIPGIWR